MDSFTNHRRKDKVVFVMGATGTGKSRLSIDLATRFHAEIINSDKMQVYKGLDVVTNKVTEDEQRSVPHHLLGVIEPNAEFSALDFRQVAALAVESILRRDKLPIIAGGSNSYIEALVNDEEFQFKDKYDCCFLWVDVSLPVLHSFVSDRVDQMVQAGLVEEVRNMFEPDADYTRGVRRAIGVPELDRYFRLETTVDEPTRARLLAEGIDEIKANTCKLACCQLEKIHRLGDVWEINRLDATHVFHERGKEALEAYEKLVVGPGAEIVQKFLYEDAKLTTPPIVTATTIAGAATLAAAPPPIVTATAPSPIVTATNLAAVVAGATR
ncbi:adenylate isopentenyltransferase 3, chloroplastic-like [Tasmannia lanceolata]|uniref:adenylate isopentenyltransferase 3, chloroplastic-like n=1 Tax=Tasmannia lanceolata TaxID=3420 RepID=UPI004063C9D6